MIWFKKYIDESQQNRRIQTEFNSSNPKMSQNKRYFQKIEILSSEKNPANQLFKHRRVLLLKGLLALFLGVFALISPQMTIILLVIYLGLILVASGVFITFAAVGHLKHNKHRRVRLLEGIFDIVAGLFIAFYPDISFALLLFIFVIWIFGFGLIQLVNAFKIHKHSLLYIFNAFLAFALCFFIILFPIKSLDILIYLLGGVIIIFGLTLSYLSFLLRNIDHQHIVHLQKIPVEEF